GRPHEHVHRDVGILAHRPGAVVGTVIPPAGDDPPFVVEGYGERDFLLARMAGGGERFEAILDPFERAAEQARARDYRDLFLPGEILAPEAAAHVFGKGADRGFRQFESQRDIARDEVGALATDPDRHFLRTVASG